jgi:hypothetical protein
MARVKLKNGDVLQIPLPKKLGFANAKHIDLLELNPSNRYPTLIRVYNKRFLHPDVAITNLEKLGLLLSPLLIAGIQPTVSNGEWKIIGNLPLTNEEKHIPHYKYLAPPKAYNPEDEKDWYYLIDADIKKKVNSTYGKIKHLESIGATGAALVGTKLAMAFLKDEGKNIEDFFDLNEHFEKTYFEEVTQIDAYYKQPKYMQGKALE